MVAVQPSSFSPPRESELRIARATESHRSHVLELLSEHLPGTDVARHHEWLYERNPHGRSLTMIAYDHRGVPAGITSMFPRRVLVNGAECIGSIGGDGYVRPAFRCRGIATALHRACLDAMPAAGIEFMFGPPEPTNLRALVRAGAHVVTNMRRFVRPRGARFVIDTFDRIFASGRRSLVPIEGLDQRVAEVWDELKAEGGVIGVRDPAHYAWRFGQSPVAKQEAFALVDGARTLALCAIERRGSNIALIDFAAPSHRALEALAGIAAACEEGSLSILLNEHGALAKKLWRGGFVGRETKPFQVLVSPTSTVATTLLDGPGWYYTWGDGDVDQVL